MQRGVSKEKRAFRHISVERQSNSIQPKAKHNVMSETQLKDSLIRTSYAENPYEETLDVRAPTSFELTLGNKKPIANESRFNGLKTGRRFLLAKKSVNPYGNKSMAKI